MTEVLFFGTVAVTCVTAVTLGALTVVIMVIEMVDDYRAGL